jgi:hypothetical protein
MHPGRHHALGRTCHERLRGSDAGSSHSHSQGGSQDVHGGRGQRRQRALQAVHLPWLAPEWVLRTSGETHACIGGYARTLIAALCRNQAAQVTSTTGAALHRAMWRALPTRSAWRRTFTMLEPLHKTCLKGDGPLPCKRAMRDGLAANMGPARAPTGCSAVAILEVQTNNVFRASQRRDCTSLRPIRNLIA